MNLPKGYTEQYDPALWNRGFVFTWSDPLNGWVEYADQYHQSSGFEPPETISEDAYTSQYWLSIGENIIELLSNETGRFDCGTLDSLVRRIAMNEGFTNDLTVE